MPDDTHGNSGWQQVVDTVKPAIVQLQVTAVRAFHDSIAGSRSGTGFVVDAENGLLLTNRHVVSCGPQRASATFVGCPSMEELPVEVAYVDPGHDFALLRFDPKRLRQTPRAQVGLDPAGCRVQEEVCMLGNDANEKMQILRGSISRVDREAPEIHGDGNHDENTFYALAGMGACGDSSGSPVVNKQGNAVGLYVAGRPGTVHALLLPLQRVAHILKLVQLGTPVPRGTLSTRFEYESFPQCRRLGVPESFVQHNVLGCDPPAGGTFTPTMPPGGMLVVRQCVPGTLASTVLQAGDVLLELEGLPCVDFVLLEDKLDEKVGGSVRLAVCRGSERVETTLEVQDFHNLMPQSFVELGFGIFHEVPYSTAMKHNVPLQGIYVAQPGFVFGQAVASDVIIKAINGFPCHDISSFIEMLEEVADNEFFSVSWMTPGSEQDRRVHEEYAKMQRQWSLFTAWILHRGTRAWSPRRLASSRGRTGAYSDDSTTASPFDDATGDEGISSDAATSEEHVQMSVCSDESMERSAKPSCEEVVAASHDEDMPPAKKARTTKLSGAIAALDQSACSVVFKVAHHLDLDVFPGGGDAEDDIVELHGVGIVIDADRGLILTDRGTVPQRLADIEVSLNGESRCASVWHMHPEHSIVVLKLDEPMEPMEPMESTVSTFGKAATFVQHDFVDGEDVEFVGVDKAGVRFSSQVQIQTVRLGKFPRHWPPRWREKNLEAVILVDDPQDCTSGVLCDSRGNIHALYAVVQAQDKDTQFRCGYGIPTDVLQPVLQQLARPDGGIASPVVPSLEVEFKNAELHKLQRLPPKLRPSSEWIQRLQAEGDKVLQVSVVTGTGPCHSVLKVGDLLVAVQGEVVTTVHAVEAVLQKAIADTGARESDSIFKMKLTVLRQGVEDEVEVMVPLLASDGAARVLLWHGLLLQETPRAVHESRSSALVPTGVHISHTFLGSPADANGIMGDFLVAVDGEPIPTLDAVVRLSSEKQSGSSNFPPSYSSMPSTSLSRQRHHLRVESADVAGRRFVSMLEPDPLFWPTAEISQDEQGSWSCVECA